MPTVTVQIPNDVEDLMREFKSVDWSAIARHAISQKVQQLAFLKYFASESDLTQKDAIELGNKVNVAVSKKYKKLM